MANEIGNHNQLGRRGQHWRDSDVAILAHELHASFDQADVTASDTSKRRFACGPDFYNIDSRNLCRSCLDPGGMGSSLSQRLQAQVPSHWFRSATFGARHSRRKIAPSNHRSLVT